MAPEAGDDDAHRPPPPPLDRVWLHPSELGAATPPHSGAAGRLPLVITAVVVGAALATGVLLFSGFVLRDESTRAESASVDLVASADELSTSIVLVSSLGPSGKLTGSGVSLGDGQVVTSEHLANGASEVSVTDAKGTSYTSRVVGSDEESELALLEVDASLPAAPLGRADLLDDDAPLVVLAATNESGHWMYQARLRDRDLMVTTAGGAAFAGLLATDAPTDATYAGGALVDGSGMVVGVLVTPPGSDVTGLAVPIEKVSGVCDQLRRSGTADHGWLGLVGADAPAGVQVRAVIDESPAARAGLRAGDTIRAIGDERIDSLAGLVAAVRARRSGDEVRVVLADDSHRERTVTVTLAPLDDLRAAP